MKITLLSIGKTKQKEYAVLEQEYAKRMSGRFQFTTHYVKNEKELLKAAQQLQGTIVLMDENGSTMNSREFAQFIDRSSRSSNHLTFIIGDAEGFSADMRALQADIIALSEMTYPHEMARVVLIEQIYRAQTILDGHPYHK